MKSVPKVCDRAGMAMTASSASWRKALGGSEGKVHQGVEWKSGSDFRWRVRAHKAEFPWEPQSPK